MWSGFNPVRRTSSLGLAVALGFAAISADAQANNDQFAQYVPEGWVLESVTKGDLNKDQKADVALVIRNTDPANVISNDGLGGSTLDTNPRRLVVLFETNDAFRKVVSTDQFLPPINSADTPCLADPIGESRGLEIKNGVLSVNMNYWLSCGSWFVTNYGYKFRYQNNRFELIGLDVMSFHRASGDMEEVSINYSTWRKKVTTGLSMFEEGTESKPVVKWEKIKQAKRYDLSTVTTEQIMDDSSL